MLKQGRDILGLAFKKSVCSHVKDRFEEDKLGGVLQYVQVIVRKILEVKMSGHGALCEQTEK